MTKSKRRKKTHPHPTQSQAKVVGKVIHRMSELCALIKCDVMKHITTLEDFKQVCLCRLRIGSVRSVICDFDYTCNKNFYSKLIKICLKSYSIHIKGINSVLNFEDLLLIDALKSYIQSSFFKAPQQSDFYIKELDVFFDSPKGLMAQLLEKLRFMVLMENLPNEVQLSCFIGFERIISANSLFLRDLVFDLYIKRPVKEYITINNSKRVIYQLIIYQIETDYITIHFTRQQLNHLYKGEKEKLAVYIQSHAIDRYLERASPINICTLKLHFATYMLAPLPFIIRNNKLLIPIKVLNVRIGYFVAEIIDEKVIIKTFILASQASAPEGRKFQKLTGFSKPDMSYWDITKLDTFINNTMEPDNPLYTYFEESNLLPLFNICKDLIAADEKSDIHANWAALSQCLNKQNSYQALSSSALNEIS